jgi:hypothetical protein
MEPCRQIEVFSLKSCRYSAVGAAVHPTMDNVVCHALCNAVCNKIILSKSSNAWPNASWLIQWGLRGLVLQGYLSHNPYEGKIYDMSWNLHIASWYTFPALQCTMQRSLSLFVGMFVIVFMCLWACHSLFKCVYGHVSPCLPVFAGMSVLVFLSWKSAVCECMCGLCLYTQSQLMHLPATRRSRREPWWQLVW